MFDFRKLNDILTAPKGYRATDALILTYSLNLKSLNDLLLFSGITETYFRGGRNHKNSSNGASAFPRHVTCVMQKDRAVTGDTAADKHAYYARLLNKEGSIKKIARESRSVHPKLLVFLYQKKNEESEEQEQIIRLIISSKNITSSNYLEGAICVEGVPGGQDVPANADLISLIKNLLSEPRSDEQEQLLGALSKTNFIDSVRCILGDDGDDDVAYSFVRSVNDQDTIAKAMPKGVDRVRIISPFLGTWGYTEEFLKDAFGNNDDLTNCDWRIITREYVQPDSLPNGELPEGKFFYPGLTGNSAGESQASEETEPVTLHAKVYGFTKTDENGLESMLLLGSANFSKNGLERNHELMLKISSKEVDFVDWLDCAALNLGKCSVTQEPDEGLPEGGELAPEETSAEELAEMILRERGTDELARFIQHVLDRTIRRDTMLDEFIKCIVNAKDDKRETIITRACDYIAADPDVRSNPYIEEAAIALGMEKAADKPEKEV